MCGNPSIWFGHSQFVYVRLNFFNHLLRCLCHPQVGETLIYDPILVEEELLVAEKLGFSRIQRNEVYLHENRKVFAC